MSIPSRAIAVITIYGLLDLKLYQVWGATQATTDMDWEIACQRVRDPLDRAVRCTRVWLNERLGEVEKYPNADFVFPTFTYVDETK